MLEESPQWQALQEHQRRMQDISLRELFTGDAERFDRCQIEAAGWFLDYSKSHLSDVTHELLIDLAQASSLAARREAMFAGEVVNPTEGRAALHVALRNISDRAIRVDGEDVMPGIQAVRERCGRFAESLRSGEWLGHSGKTITDVVNIGIGGSDLGPLMAVEALAPFNDPRLSMHFVSNVDGAHLWRVLEQVDPETTLFIIASKTFTTLETLTNAHSARNWFLQSDADESAVARHFVAVSTNREAVAAFGIDTDNMFEFWDWVGGRYSLWSAIGLPIMIAIGEQRFAEFLAGAHAMDEHFLNAPLDRNMPVTLALLTVWYASFWHAGSHLVAPYDQSLHRFPAYLQQLTMESNGKSVHLDGSPVETDTSPVVWGEPGTNGQHAFFQLLHQGTHLIPTDFILPLESLHGLPEHHRLLAANCFAQSEALMKGKTADELAEEMRAAGASDDDITRLEGHRSFGGNRPSNTLLTQRLDPRALGALIALYEHKVFVEAAIWDINPFDQWGVELGKALASTIADELAETARIDSHDSSTNGLINRYIKLTNLQA